LPLRRIESEVVFWLPIGDVVVLVLQKGKSGAIGDRPSWRARRAWDGWVPGHGDPAQWLLGELAAMHAIDPPGADDETIELTPLALWALREQLLLDGIEIPVLAAASPRMTASYLVALADGVSDAEFESEVAAWMAARSPDRAARELLAFAAFSGAQPRLAAVNLVRRIGIDAHRAWGTPCNGLSCAATRGSRCP